MAAATTATRTCLATLMSPTSANLMGNVHGGSILRLCEEAGRIISTRYSRGSVALVGASQTEFRKPIHVGEVARVDATLDYVGRHVMRVSMAVEAEQIDTGRKRTTNTASMWYSTIDISNGCNKGEMMAGSRILHPLNLSEVAPEAVIEHRKSVAAREKIPLNMRSEAEFPVVLQELPGVDAIATHPFISAGYILKLMDSGAALAAVAHAKHQCVTVLLDKVCFRTNIRMGDLCTVRAGVTYTSSRSMEVVAQVWKAPSGIVDGLIVGEDKDVEPVCAVEARFVFVALGADGNVVTVPGLPIEQRRMSRWEVGAAKHEERVAERARSAKY